jgi:hypothetical protein
MVEQILTVYFHSSRWAEGKRTGSFFYSRAQAERARVELEQGLTEAEKAGGGHFAIRNTQQPVNEKMEKGIGNER